MKRNSIETVVAFIGLATMYYGARIDQCLHAPGQPSSSCHSTPTGATIFLVGAVVCFIGIAPWKIYAKNYVCQLCGIEFGGDKEGKVSEYAHFRMDHPDFYTWWVRWNRWSNAFALISFAYIFGVLALVATVPYLNTLASWWLIGFVGVGVALILDLADLHFVTNRFRNKWLTLHPDARDPTTLRVTQEKLSAGVTAWKEFTRGREEYMGGLMTSGLKRKGNFAGGYGIYFTSQRIIGVRTSRWFVVILVLAVLAGIGGATAISLVVGFSPAFAYFIGLPIIVFLIAWGQRRLGFQDPLTLEDLEQEKDFEIRREDISGINMEKPGTVRRGHLMITARTGKGLTVLITQEYGVFERLKGLVSGFCFVPSAAAIKGRQPTINLPRPSYAYRGHTDNEPDEPGETKRFLDESYVEQRDFEWCPHCANAVVRGTRVCPSCGKTIG